jgi:hypothetical protein
MNEQPSTLSETSTRGRKKNRHLTLQDGNARLDRGGSLSQEKSSERKTALFPR